jgi:hypothetical protein
MRLLYIKNFAKHIGLHTHWALDLGPRAYIKSWEDDRPYMCRFRDCKKQRARQTWRKPTGQMAVPRVHSWLHHVFSVFHNCNCRKKPLTTALGRCGGATCWKPTSWRLLFQNYDKKKPEDTGISQGYKWRWCHVPLPRKILFYVQAVFCAVLFIDR